MRLIGIDAGTTSVSGVLLNTETATVEKTLAREHHASLPASAPDEDYQDPDVILNAVREITDDLVSEARSRGAAPGTSSPVAALSLTGQVHGILSVDADGRAVGPLATWQDNRASRVRDGASNPDAPTWADWAREQTGYAVPSGYGLLTHCVNLHEERVPADAVRLTSILGYLTMRLTGSAVPRIEHSDAHSLGFSRDGRRFDTEACARVGIADSLLPEIVSAGTLIGHTPDGVAVFAAVGDNQAGFVGSVPDPSAALVNVGTSAQLSVYAPRDVAPGAESAESRSAGLEDRPFPGGGHLLCGAALCGGSAYRMLGELFREVCVRFAGEDPGPLYDSMNAVDRTSLREASRLDVDTRFLGARNDPDVRGAIRGIGSRNLTVDYLVEGFLRGIVGELHGFWNELPAQARAGVREIVGVGNAMRRNPLLRAIAGKTFGVPVTVAGTTEEAALGAAVIAGVGAGAYASYLGPDRPIR